MPFWIRKLWPFIFLFSSCTLAPGNLQSRQASDLAAREIKRIAVLPPDLESPEGKTKEEKADLLLSRHLYSTMSARPEWQIVSDREVREVGSSLPHGAEATRSRRLGELVYADAIISGRILRYRERVGKEWGAKSPASVSFVLDLWDVKRGDLIWSARFDETQKSLSENILGIGDVSQRGVKWLTADELTYHGVKKAVDHLHQTLYRGTS
jgi:hypothetical protein